MTESFDCLRVCISILYLFGIARCGYYFGKLLKHSFFLFQVNLRVRFFETFQIQFWSLWWMRFSLFFLWLCNLTSVRWKQAIFQLRVFNKHMTWTVLGIGEQRFCYAGSTCLCCRLEHTELKWTEVFHVAKGKYCFPTSCEGQWKFAARANGKPAKHP